MTDFLARSNASHLMDDRVVAFHQILARIDECAAKFWHSSSPGVSDILCVYHTVPNFP